MEYTEKYGLKLPEDGNAADVSDLNDNFQTIDELLTKVVYSNTQPTSDLVEGMIWLKPAEG